MKKSSLLGSKPVAVLVPLSDRPDLSADEQISLRHLNHFLGHYDKYMLAGDSFAVDYPGFKVKRFSDRFFGSAQAHRNLLFTRGFYEAFLEYKYVLLYHLDALVFSDQLLRWCETDFDYLGAPWVKHKGTPYEGNSFYEGKVGNGGFSLRKVRSFLKVLNSSRYATDLKRYGVRFRPRWWAGRAKALLKYCKGSNNIQWELQRVSYNEDRFWANRAIHYYPEFRIPSVDTALAFAFECVPRYCFQLTNHTLPFGCHAWPRYDREFWEPFLLK